MQIRSTRPAIALTLALAVAIAVTLAAPLGTLAARPDQPTLTRDVFVHYPRGFDAKPAKPGGGACPEASTCPDYKLTRLVWSQAAAAAGIPYLLDNSGSGLSGGTVATVVANSFAVWTDASLTDGDAQSIRFTGGTGTVGDPMAWDAVNSVTFRNLNALYPNAIGVTLAWRYTGSKEIIGADTIFNIGPGFVWSTDGSAGKYDLMNIGVHEFGHWLQLGDLYNSQDAQLTMYGYGSTSETQKRDLGLGDQLGVQKLY